MRLPLLTLCLCALVGPAIADNTFDAKTQIYADSDHTTVVSPLVAISRDTWRGGTLSASYVADVVSSASVDVVSNATKRMTDFRSEISGAIAQKVRATTLTASYVYSTEHDYASHNASFSLSQDLLQKNTTLAFGAAFSQNTVRRSGDESFRRELWTAGASATWTQTLTRKAILQVGYTFSYNNGYQASPYRFVRVYTPDNLDSSDLKSVLYKVPETEPGLRLRHAFVAGVNGYLGRHAVLQGDYRFYFDDWGLQAHTIQLRLLLTFKDLTIRLRERFHFQSGVSFYRPYYTEVQQYMTADRELTTFASNLIGLKLTWRLPFLDRALAAEIKGDFVYYHYNEFPLLPQRTGGVAEFGLSLVY